jgi:hypothetical protein
LLLAYRHLTWRLFRNMLRSIATLQLPVGEPKFGCQSDPPERPQEMYRLLRCRQDDPQIRVPKSYPVKVSLFEQTCRRREDFNNYLELQEWKPRVYRQPLMDPEWKSRLIELASLKTDIPREGEI